MINIIALLAAGIVLGFLLKNNSAIIGGADRMLTWSVYLLLFLMGISVGVNDAIIKNIGTIGLKALALTFGTVAGSMAIMYVVYRLFFKES